MRILCIEASPRKNRSASNEVSGAFLAAWKSCDENSYVDRMNVWQTRLPEFDGAALEAKYAGVAGRRRTPDQRRAWRRIQELADRFFAADVIVFATPMWNFGIPYKLKHLIDLISQKDVLFRFDQHGLRGMLTGRPCVVVAARGGGFGPDMPPEEYDFQISYLRVWAHMVGIDGVRSVIVDRTFETGAVEDHSRAAAAADAARLARALWAERNRSAAA
jgi:FMN-dependent NADH-azoreductase